MADENLKRISGLCAEFMDAIDNSPEADDPTVQANTRAAMQALDPRKQAKLQTLGAEVMSGSAISALSGNPSEGLLKKNIELREMMADLFTRVLPAETLARLMPAELKNKRDADTLEGMGAKTLARLCRPAI